MRRTLWLALPLLGLTPAPAAAQSAGLELRGVVFYVEDGQADKKYLPNVLMTVIEVNGLAKVGCASLTHPTGLIRPSATFSR